VIGTEGNHNHAEVRLALPGNQRKIRKLAAGLKPPVDFWSSSMPVFLSTPSSSRSLTYSTEQPLF
jgi:hypothetical protein